MFGQDLNLLRLKHIDEIKLRCERSRNPYSTKIDYATEREAITLVSTMISDFDMLEDDKKNVKLLDLKISNSVSKLFRTYIESQWELEDLKSKKSVKSNQLYYLYLKKTNTIKLRCINQGIYLETMFTAVHLVSEMLRGYDYRDDIDLKKIEIQIDEAVEKFIKNNEMELKIIDKLVELRLLKRVSHLTETSELKYKTTRAGKKMLKKKYINEMEKTLLERFK